MELLPEEYPELRALLIAIGAAMTRAGDSVDAIQEALIRVAEVNGVSDVEVIVLPTVLLIQTSKGAEGRVELRSTRGASLRLDQVSAIYDVAAQAERRLITPAEGLHRLAAIERLRPSFPPMVRAIGHAVQAAGLALLLQPSWSVFAVCAALGLLVGIVKLIRWQTLELVLPVIASFTIGVIVLAGAKRIPDADNPLRTLIPPLVTFLPGAALTIATVELAAQQVIAGASRLVYATLQLVLLAFGIVAAAVLVGTPEVLIDREYNQLGPWAPWLGVLIFGVGLYVHLSAPVRSLPWIVLVLYVAYIAQTVGGHFFGGALSGFFGALVMTPVVFTVARIPTGPPSMVTFLPAFWLLVPGATGLIGVTELLSDTNDLSSEHLVVIANSIVAIALGVLLGTAIYRAVLARLTGSTEAPPPDSGDRAGGPPT
ncbi:MAG: threonine/serine ThrE exporter family protein [Acidimicrobiales bacterium]